MFTKRVRPKANCHYINYIIVTYESNLVHRICDEALNDSGESNVHAA